LSKYLVSLVLRRFETIMVNVTNIRIVIGRRLAMVVNDGERWIAAQNIQHFEGKLEQEKDEGQRRVLRDLIEREREKLRKTGGQKPH
jgi:hypothetical protein